VRRVIPYLAILIGSSFGPGAAAQGLDLLAGRAGTVDICAFAPEEAIDAFGIPSRMVVDDPHMRLEFSHHGFVLVFSAAHESTALDSATVYAVDRDGYRGYHGHFLGTVANGTRSEPVRRLLRSARADITRDEPERIEARLQGFELAIGFLYDAIDWVTLTCPSDPDTTG
jgi:hypothetical protein